MSEQANRAPAGPEPEPARQPYTPPRLVRDGTVEDLTRGTLNTGAGDPSVGIP
jgi:hypothetical protein